MGNGKKKPSNSREVTKQESSRSGAIVLALIVGVVIGSAGTYVFTKTPEAASKPAVATMPTPAPNFGLTPSEQTAITSPTAYQQFNPAPQQQYTPAPQPPGPVPAGQVWSVEHGHWHAAPAAATIPTATPLLTTPVPATTPAEKKE